MAFIFSSKNFLVQSAEKPLVDRAEGGHITIDPKAAVCTRQELTPMQAIELMRLIAVAGEAMTVVLRRHGVDMGRINYQDNGNWAVFKPEGPKLHYHLYGRAKSAVAQRYGQSLYFPHKDERPEFYQNLQPLTHDDVEAIGREIASLLQTEKYSDAAWMILPDHSVPNLQRKKMLTQINFFEEKLAFEIDPSDLFDALNNGERMVVIDARKSDAFAKERIPGAVNLPYREMNENTTQGFDKGLTYAVYCDGVGCNASTKGCYKLSLLGFNVKEVIGGITAWKADGFATEGKAAVAGEQFACAC